MRVGCGWEVVGELGGEEEEEEKEASGRREGNTMGDRVRRDCVMGRGKRVG
jgi:hypothetical protein